MDTRATCGVVLALAASACGGVDAAEPAPPRAGPEFVEYFGPADPNGGTLTVTGHLEGELRGVSVASDTLENSGSFGFSYDGSGYLNVNVATRGDAGAAMLIVSLSQPELEVALTDGHWAGLSSPTDPRVSSTVSSCAGPTLGDWPYELGSTEYEMDSSEDPEQPGNIVLVVKAQFPRTELDSSSTTDLVGTIRFERFARPE